MNHTKMTPYFLYFRLLTRVDNGWYNLYGIIFMVLDSAKLRNKVSQVSQARKIGINGKTP